MRTHKPETDWSDYLLFSVWAFLTALFFSFVYIHVVLSTSEGHFADAAKFNIPYPQRLRFLLPVLVVHFVRPDVAESNLFRTCFSTVFMTGVFLLLPTYAKRLGLELRSKIMLFAAMLCVLFAHYVASKFYNVYYVYDMPSIFFYMVIFLLLTDARPRMFLGALPLLVLFSYSRETIIIAVFHAVGYIVYTESHLLEFRKKWDRLLLIAVALLAVGIARLSMLQLLGGHLADQAIVYDPASTKLRFLYNLTNIYRDHGYFRQVVLMGCGILFWLPFAYHKLSGLLKWLIISSLPAMAMLLWAGNFMELRIYNELVPLMAILLYEMDRLMREKCKAVISNK
jgi:hypothetical protein